MITLETARQIAKEWHSGQTSALYAFASTGNVDSAPFHDYMREITECQDSLDENLSSLFSFLAWECAGNLSR